MPQSISTMDGAPVDMVSWGISLPSSEISNCLYVTKLLLADAMSFAQAIICNKNRYLVAKRPRLKYKARFKAYTFMLSLSNAGDIKL